jgi:hypothetical protein
MKTIMESNNHPFLIISGRIPANKKQEFEQTFRIGFSSLSRDCISKSLSQDCDQAENYYFFSLWPSDKSLRIFMDSPEFQLLNGVFHALGRVSQTSIGNMLSTDSEMPINLS